jgi:hypothetical protein
MREFDVIGQGRPWNPFKGGFVPYLREMDSERLTWQRDRAVHFLAFEGTKKSPRPERVKLLRKCERLARLRHRSYYRLISTFRRCEMAVINTKMAETMAASKTPWPDGAMGVDYMGGGVVGLFEGKNRTEMRLSQAAWELRRVDSELRLLVALYGDLSGIW